MNGRVSEVQQPGGAGAGAGGVWYSVLQELRLLPGHVIKNLHGEPEEKDLKADQLVANRRRCLLYSREINTMGGSIRRRRDSSSTRNGGGCVQQ